MECPLHRIAKMAENQQISDKISPNTRIRVNDHRLNSVQLTPQTIS